MLFEDYKRETAEDVKQLIEWGELDNLLDASKDDVSQETINAIIKDARDDDGVTGNGSGSYTYSRAEAEENVSDLIFDDAFLNECTETGLDLSKLFSDGPEAVDVAARFLALDFADDAIRDAANERIKELIEEAKAASAFFEISPDVYVARCMDRLQVDKIEALNYGTAVRLCDPVANFSVWLVVQDGEYGPEADFSQEIFFIHSRYDMWRQEFQNNFDAASYCQTLAVDYVTSHN